MSKKTMFLITATSFLMQFTYGLQPVSAAPIEKKEIIAEMLCVRQIVQHNMGGQAGYEFAKTSVQQMVDEFKGKQVSTGVAQACNAFLKSTQDPGFDKDGNAANYLEADVRMRNTDSAAFGILEDLINPSVRCASVGGFAPGGAFVAIGVGIDGRLCSATDGFIFVETSASISAGGGFGGGGVITVGGGKTRNLFSELHQTTQDIKQNGAVGGVAFAAGFVDSDRGVSLGLGVGYGLAGTAFGGGKGAKLPLAHNQNHLLMYNFLSHSK